MLEYNYWLGNLNLFPVLMSCNNFVLISLMKLFYTLKEFMSHITEDGTWEASTWQASYVFPMFVSCSVLLRSLFKFLVWKFSAIKIMITSIFKKSHQKSHVLLLLSVLLLISMSDHSIDTACSLNSIYMQDPCLMYEEMCFNFVIVYASTTFLLSLL